MAMNTPELPPPPGAASLAGTVAVVTAGCGGIGLVIARQLAAAGARVVATSRDPGGLAAADTVETLAAEGIEARRLTFGEDETAEFFRAVAADLGRVDILVHAAAGRTPGLAVEQVTVEAFRQELDDSLIAAFLCARAAVDAGAHTVVQVGSVYGVLAVDHRIYTDPARQTPITYACAKAALVQMTRYLAALWAPRGVRVNCVSVGGIRRAQEPEFLANYSRRVPMGRMAEPEEVAGAVLFLASPQSGYVTGENLMVDGGLHAW